MEGKKLFGEFFKARRIANKKTLRQFCIENAAAETGKIPEDIMAKGKIEDKLPILFRTLRGQKVSDDKLDELIKMLRDA